MLSRSKSSSIARNSAHAGRTDVRNQIAENCGTQKRRKRRGERRRFLIQSNYWETEYLSKKWKKFESPESKVEILKHESDDKKQYQRRTLLRLFNVLQEDEESSVLKIGSFRQWMISLDINRINFHHALQTVSWFLFQL